MLSENDKKILDLIEKLVKISLNKITDSYFIKSTFAEIVRTYENLDDVAIRTILENRSKEISATNNQNKIRDYLEEILKVIKDKRDENLKKYIDLGEAKVDKSDQYKSDRIKYKDKNIEKTEDKILNSPNYQENLHEPIKSKYWGRNCRHARLTNNLRIIYIYEPKKKFEFVAIVTHNDLDKI